MAFPIRVEDNLVVVDTGEVDVDQAGVIQTLTKLRDEPEIHRGRHMMILDPGSRYHPSMEEIKQFITLIKSLLGGPFRRIALVVPRDLHFGLGRMTETLIRSETGKFSVFRSETEAREWLAE
jgi:hypothetical protein